MDCSRYHDEIQALADGTLGPIRRAQLQVHLDECRACRELAADLVRIRNLAATLDRVEPPDAVWIQIAGRLRQEGRVAAVAAAPRHSRRHVAALALAATLVIAVGASIFTLLPRHDAEQTTASAPAGNAAAEDPVQSFANEMRLAEQHYQNAIARLEEAAKSDEDVMDPQTAAVVKKNLQIIDQAIAESRDALRVEPQSAAARDSLFDALKNKVIVLQKTIALMNEIRKGNPEAGGPAAEGSNKS